MSARRQFVLLVLAAIAVAVHADGEFFFIVHIFAVDHHEISGQRCPPLRT